MLVPPLCRETSTFAVRGTDVSRHNGGTLGAPLKPLRDDSALRRTLLVEAAPRVAEVSDDEHGAVVELVEVAPVLGA